MGRRAGFAGERARPAAGIALDEIRAELEDLRAERARDRRAIAVEARSLARSL